MSGPLDILAVLATGPKTNRELAEATYDHNGSVARTMAKLIASGRAVRINEGGRGAPAIYALPEKRHE